MEKQCKKCLKTRPIDDFYKHSMMADGHLSKCKECTKADVIENRNANLDYYRNYDRDRYDNNPKRRTSRGTHPNHNEHAREWANRNRERISVAAKVSRAIKSGILVRPTSCSECGADGVRIEGHHRDYSKPLEVEWLCTRCHGKTREKERKDMEARKRGGYKGSMLPTRADVP